jgi:hypothetical protein
VAVAVILLVATGVAYKIHKAPVPFQEGSTAVFEIPSSTANPNPYSVFTTDLLNTSELTAQLMMSPQSQARVQQAGGSASYYLAMYNLYNEEYPNYSDPFVIVTVTGATAQQVQKTYAVVTTQLRQALASEQAVYGALPRNQITEHIVGDSGVVALTGSKKRVYAGLAALVLITIFGVLRFLDRRRLPALRELIMRWLPRSVREDLRSRVRSRPARDIT